MASRIGSGVNMTSRPPGARRLVFLPGLVNLGFIKAAIRRSAWLVVLLVVVGLIGGFGAYVKFPPTYQASASVLLTISPYEDTLTAPANNVSMAMTTPVAALALQKLGL